MNGRRPMPTNLRILRGETRPSRLNRNEPKPAPRKPTCPKHLSPAAKRVFRAICVELRDMGLLSKADTFLIEVLSNAVVHYRANVEVVDLGGVLTRARDGNLVRNPASTPMRQHADLIVRVTAELGLSPSARSRLTAIPTERDDQIARRYF